VRQDLQARNLQLYARKLEGGSTEPQIEVVQSKSQPDNICLKQSRIKNRVRNTDTNGIVLEQEPLPVCQSPVLPVQDSEMVYEELMSALGDLDVTTFRMPGVATYNATAMPVRRSLAAAVEQELVQTKGIVEDQYHKHQVSEKLARQPFRNVSNILCSQQSQPQPMLKSLDAQERSSFDISTRKPALGMYQPPWRVAAEAQRRPIASTVGCCPRESRH
jgi:hypothetical protein